MMFCDLSWGCWLCVQVTYLTVVVWKAVLVVMVKVVEVIDVTVDEEESW